MSTTQPTPAPCKKNDPVFLTDTPAPTPRTDDVAAKIDALACQWRTGQIDAVQYEEAARLEMDRLRTLERELTEARATLLAREGELDSMSAALAAKDAEIARLKAHDHFVQKQQVEPAIARAKEAYTNRSFELLNMTARAEKAEAELAKQRSGEGSDGYHTFNELYEHRHALFLMLMRSHPSLSWISRKHHDGSEWSGWFIAGIKTPCGDISYHFPSAYWNYAVKTGVAVLETGMVWDGHTSAQVVDRLRLWVQIGTSISAERDQLRAALAAAKEDVDLLTWFEDWGYKDGVGWVLALPDNQYGQTRDIRAAIADARKAQP